MKFTLRMLSIMLVTVLLVSNFSAVNVLADEDLPSEETTEVFGQGLLQTPDEYIDQVAFNYTPELTAVQLPSSVDNSTSPYFPPIKSQGAQGSCAAFATTYYGFTYYKNRLYNTDASLVENQCSPAWTYNFLAHNNGSGISFWNAFHFLRDHGSVSLEELPYYSWIYNALPSDEAARNALQTRIDNINTVGINTGVSAAQNTNNFQWVKQQLAQGELFIVSFVCGDNAYNCDSVLLPNGENLVYQVNSADSGHAGTVVGYDDNISFDINGDGVIENAEKGAFKLANSWGTSSDFSPGGYYWVLYDALNINSEISGDWNTKTSTRTSAFAQYNNGNYNIFWGMSVSAYNPLLIGKATINISRNSFHDYWAIYSETPRKFPCNEINYNTSATRTLNTTVYLDYTTMCSFVGDYNVGKTYFLDFGNGATYSNVEMIDSNGNAITSFVDETNPEYEKYAKSCVVNCPIGDVNYDGVLTQEDANAILRFAISGSPYSYFQEYLADYNQDGVISTADTRALLLAIDQ